MFHSGMPIEASRLAPLATIPGPDRPTVPVPAPVPTEAQHPIPSAPSTVPTEAPPTDEIPRVPNEAPKSQPPRGGNTVPNEAPPSEAPSSVPIEAPTSLGPHPGPTTQDSTSVNNQSHRESAAAPPSEKEILAGLVSQSMASFAAASTWEEFVAKWRDPRG
jgi:hypothetical protein